MRASTGSRVSSESPSPRARPASSAAPAEAASPERWRVRGHSEHGGEDLDPHGQARPGAAQGHARRGRAAETAHRHHLHHPQHVPGDRLHDGPRQVAGPMGGPQAHEPRPGVVAPPRGAGTVEPRHRHHAPRSGRALTRQAGQFVRRAAEQPPEPAQEGSGGGQAALEQPAPVRRPCHHRTGRRGDGSLVHGHRHVAGGAPADHGVVLRRTRPQHLALAVAGADDHGNARAQPQLRARNRLQLADHRVGCHDARKLPQRRAGQLPHRVAVEVVQTAARRERGVGDRLIRHAVDDQVARRKDEMSRFEAPGLVVGQPEQLRRHCPGIERDPGAGPVDVVAAHALREGRAPPPQRGGRTTRCPSRPDRPWRSRGRRSAGPPSTRRRRPRRTPAAPGPGPRRTQ